MTTSVAVEIIPPKLACTIPECENVTFYCISGDIEWLNPADVLIDDTVTNRIYGKKLRTLICTYICLLVCMLIFLSANFFS